METAWCEEEVLLATRLYCELVFILTDVLERRQLHSQDPELGPYLLVTTGPERVSWPHVSHLGLPEAPGGSRQGPPTLPLCHLCACSGLGHTGIALFHCLYLHSPVTSPSQLPPTFAFLSGIWDGKAGCL